MGVMALALPQSITVILNYINTKGMLQGQYGKRPYINTILKDMKRNHENIKPPFYSFRNNDFRL